MMSRRATVSLGLCEFAESESSEAADCRGGKFFWVASTAANEVELRAQARVVCRDHHGELVGLHQFTRIQPDRSPPALRKLLELAHDYPGECLMGQMFVYDPGERELLLGQALQVLRS